MKAYGLMANFWLKISSLIAAICLSLIVNNFFIQNENNLSVLQFVVPVELKNVPSDTMVIWPPTRQVDVTIQGPSMFLSRMTNPIFRVALPGDAGNRFVAYLRKEDLNLPTAVDVIGIKPAQIEFTLDKRVSKKVPVVVPKIGTLPEELKFDSIKVEPSEVELEGPQQELKGISAVETHPLDLRDISQSLSKSLELRVPGSLSEVKPGQVQVFVEVSSILSEDTVQKISVEIRSLGGETYKINPTEVNVKLGGTKSVLKTVKKSELIPYVRLEKLEVWPSKIKVAVDAPDRIRVLEVEPSEIEITKVVPEITPTPVTKVIVSGKVGGKK